MLTTNRKRPAHKAHDAGQKAINTTGRAQDALKIQEGDEQESFLKEGLYL